MMNFIIDDVLTTLCHEKAGLGDVPAICRKVGTLPVSMHRSSLITRVKQLVGPSAPINQLSLIDLHVLSCGLRSVLFFRPDVAFLLFRCTLAPLSISIYTLDVCSPSCTARKRKKNRSGEMGSHSRLMLTYQAGGYTM